MLNITAISFVYKYRRSGILQYECYSIMTDVAYK